MGHDHHHEHDHGHGGVHVHGIGGDTRRALILALVLNGGFLLIEAGVGWWTGSLALLSDAVHMLSDVGALIVALAAAQLARRAATTHMTFGLARAEILGAFLNGVALLLATLVIVREAIERLQEGPPSIEGLPVLAVGIVGLLINLGSAWALWRSDRDNLNVRAALAHMLADALGSVGAIVAAVLLLVGIPLADPIVSLLVAALVGWGAFSVLRDAGRVLMQLPPRGLDVGAVRDALLGIDGVSAVHDLHAWSLDGHRPIVSAHLVLDEGRSWAGVMKEAQDRLEDGFHVHHSTLQVEPGDAVCDLRACGVDARR